MTSDALPTCAICCDTLGNYGGPVTLPCGHNGCLHCLQSVQFRNSQCPLCRSPFDPATQLVCNHELRDLIAMATSGMYVDEKTKSDGWEAFPTARLASECYATEFKHHRQQGRCDDVSVTEPSAPLMLAEHMPQYNHHGGNSSGGSSRGGSGELALGLEPDMGLLQLEAPHWLPDSYASSCSACHQPFRALLRLRHHCRMCGKIFCHTCCKRKLLLPPKYGQRDPQRACEMCASMLQPLQPYLAGTLSRANQPPVHDAVDSVSLRSWLNNPCTASLEADIYKAANIVQTFTRAGRLEPERSLPQAVLQGAQGLALLSVIKIGAGWSAALGTGLVVSRQANGSWSAPCAVGCFGVGWGLQLGGELTDLLLVLRTKEAVAAFCGRVQMGVGGNIAAAVGPVGRHAGASMQLGDAGAAAVYSYSCSKGAYVGVAIEGTAMMVREAVNMNFYGYPVTARQLLLEGAVPQPPAATMLYDGLHTLMHKFEQRRALGGRGVVPDRTAAAAATSTAVAAATAAAAAQAASSSTQSTAATVQAAASAVVAPARSAVTAARVQVQNWSTLMRRRPSQPQPPAQQERGEPMLA